LDLVGLPVLPVLLALLVPPRLLALLVLLVLRLLLVLPVPPRLLALPALLALRLLLAQFGSMLRMYPLVYRVSFAQGSS